ncbi:MAG: holo-ACP synthase [Lachnospiraceae bacterium]
MLIGIGTDILEIDKLRHVFSKDNYLEDSFVKKTYTIAEISQAENRSSPLQYYATRFAGKEAVFKALTQNGEDHRLIDIEILSDEYGAPHVILHGNAALLAKKREVTDIMISLSYEHRYALAFACAQK